MNIRFILLVIIITSLFLSCKKNRLNIDISDISIQKTEIKRLERDMFAMHPDSIRLKTTFMQKKYGGFYLKFINAIINYGGAFDSSYAFNLKRFINDKDMKAAYDSVQYKYNDLNVLEEDLTNAFKHYKYYFPEKNIPQVVSYISGFNYSVVSDDSTLGIGLEMYLGKNSLFYKMIQLPSYKTFNMEPDFILSDCIRGWLINEYPNNMNKQDFLSEIIHYGKIMYIVDALLPDVNDTLKIGYSTKQLEWCNKNEENMWSYISEHRLLYSNDINDIMKFTHEGPFTTAFSKDSPARTGHWIGWQIVRSYMNKNEHISVHQMLQEQDAQKILIQSKYNPKN